MVIAIILALGGIWISIQTIAVYHIISFVFTQISVYDNFVILMKMNLSSSYSMLYVKVC